MGESRGKFIGWGRLTSGEGRVSKVRQPKGDGVHLLVDVQVLCVQDDGM